MSSIGNEGDSFGLPASPSSDQQQFLAGRSCHSFDVGIAHPCLDSTVGTRRPDAWRVEQLARTRSLISGGTLQEEHNRSLATLAWARIGHVRDWVAPRVGEGQLRIFFIFFLIQTCATQLGQVNHSEANSMFLYVVVQLVSLAIAVSGSFSLLGVTAAWKVTSISVCWRFVCIAVLFTIAKLLTKGALYAGTSYAAIQIVGYAFIPMAALLSIPMLKREYGSLEWLSLGIMCFAFVSLLQLRPEGLYGMLGLPLICHILILSSCFGSALASVWSERIYKSRSHGAAGAIGDDLPFCVYKVYLDSSSLLVGLALWIIMMSLPSCHLFEQGFQADSWFGTWSWKELLTIATSVTQSWMAGLVTKRFSTVSRAIADSFVTVSVLFIINPLTAQTRFVVGAFPCALLIVIILISALIFQTGRVNIRQLRESLYGQDSPVRRESRQWLSMLRMLSCSVFFQLLATYASVLIFVAADASRTLSQQQALSRSMITPGSMVLAVYMSGVAVALTTTLLKARAGSRLHDLQLALSPAQVLRCLPSALCFALASTFLALAYAHGVSAPVATALGYVYMPISAVLSRFLLGKYYMWLEWFSLLILTFAAAAFGVMEDFFSAKQSGRSSQEQASNFVAMLFVVCSALFSVCASLIAEKVLKEEANVPFHIQKVRLDLGSVGITLLLLPVIGLVSTRVQDAFWKCRPLEPTCGSPYQDVCWAAQTFHCDPACPCTQGWGVFVAWGDWRVLLALVVNIAQGWFTGVVIKQYSTVMRAVAQASTILVIYMIGDPLVNSGSAHNAPLTLVVFLIPLSTIVFLVSASEMEKVATRMPPIPPAESGDQLHAGCTSGFTVAGSTFSAECTESSSPELVIVESATKDMRMPLTSSAAAKV